MSFTTISDVHIKEYGGEGYSLMLDFLEHPCVQSADEIYLLGDIFDLMCGPHEEYFNKYPEIFEKLAELVHLKKKLHYFEGNHDLHLSGLFEKFRARYDLPDEIFIHHEPFIQHKWGKIFYFSHGDEIPVGDTVYESWKRLVRTKPLEFIANNLFPFHALEYLGQFASEISRQSGSRSFNESAVREKYRTGILEIADESWDYMICGHNHVEDDYRPDDFKLRYLNNGYPGRSLKFIHASSEKVEFVSLD